MATITASVAGGAWNTAGAWVGGVIPTAADDVLLTVTSGNVSLPAAYTALCRSLDCTGYTATLTFAATSSVLQVGDASGGALKFVAGMTLTLTGLGTINFVSTSNNGGTGWAVTTGGKVMPNVTFNGAGGKWVQADALTATGATVTLTAGTWDTGSFAVTCGTLLSNNTNTRTLTLGSSSVTVTGGATNSLLLNGIGSSLTVTANTATITMTGSNPGPNVAASGGSGNMNGASLVLTPTANASLINAGTWANVTFTGPANKTAILTLNGANVTATGTFTVNGNSTINRVLVQSNVAGTARIITAAAVSFSNVDFADITGAGGATWNLSAITGLSGDAGGNSGMTLTAATTNYWRGNGGNWSDVTHWANTSGGAASSGRVPLSQDTVVFDSNSFSSGSQTVTVDMARMGKDITFTGATNSPGLTGGGTFYGSLMLISAMGLTGGSTSWVWAARSAATLTSAGKAFPNSLTVNAPPNVTCTLADSLSLSGAAVFSTSAGTFDANGFNVTASSWGNGSNSTRTINMGSGTWTFTQTSGGNIVSGNTTGLTLNGQGATIVISTATSNSRTIQTSSGKLTNISIVYTVAGSTGALVIAGLATFNALSVGPGRTLTLTSSVTTTVTTWDVNGTSGSPTTVNSSTPGTPATLAKADSVPTISGYLTIQDIAATPANTWYADTTSTNVSGNTGWLFTRMPVGAQRQSPWNVKGTVAQTRQALWNVRTPAAATRQVLWNVRQTVTGQRQTLWSVRAAVAASRQTTWDVRAAHGVTRQTRWHVTANVSADRALTWNVAAAVGDSRAAVWDTVAAISASPALTWAVRTPVGQQRALAWHVTTAVTASRHLRWSVKAHAAAQRAVTWDTRATVGQARTVTWRVRATAPASRSLAWRVRTSVAVTETLRWQVAQTIGAQRATTWHVKATVGAQRDLRWRTRFGPIRDLTATGAPPATPAWAGTTPTPHYQAAPPAVAAWTGAP